MLAKRITRDLRIDIVRGLALLIIVTTMGLKPSPSGESFRFLYWGDGKLPNEFAQSL